MILPKLEIIIFYQITISRSLLAVLLDVQYFGNHNAAWSSVNSDIANPRRLEAWDSPTLQDSISTKDCMQQLNLITPFTGRLQRIHVHIRLQQRSADFTWLLKNKNKLLTRNRISCDITKQQKYEVKLYNLRITLINLTKKFEVIKFYNLKITM
jgi:hypothetical protein